ncbi:MAG: tripartite tricarboxylate transporter TctB family protein [Dorea sp.]
MNKKINYIIIAIFLVLAGVVGFLMKDYPWSGITQGFGPAFYPTVLLVILLVLLLILFIQTLTNKGMEEEEKKLPELKQLKRPALLLLCMILYAILMPYLGFVITGILYLFVTMRILRADMKKSIICSVAMVVIVYLLFRYAFKVPLPMGMILGG